MESCQSATEASVRQRIGESDMEKRASTPEPPSIVLRDVTMSDLPIFFNQQLDPEANRMAAFTTKDPTDRDAFMARWARNLRDEMELAQKNGLSKVGD